MYDLWPEDIANVTAKAPVAILREQASLLGRKTRNIVEARVASTDPEPWMPRDGFGYAFLIVAPALGHYTYELFKIAHDVHLYPVWIQVDRDMRDEIDNRLRGQYLHANDTAFSPFLVGDEAQFVEFLKSIFGTSKARQVINAILAQSTTTTPQP